MDAVSALPAIVALFAAIATTYLLTKRFGSPPEQGRFASIDGLRGYLAFFVFLHHSSVWYFYLRTNGWTAPPSHLYTHLGESSIVLFFMISGFLFFSKLVHGKQAGFDWGRLYVSRFLRLVPMYLVAMSAMFLIVAILSSGTLKEPPLRLLKGAVHWLGFTMLGEPDLNGVPFTSSIVAAVTWTLRYEWWFYCSLPLLALTVRMIPPFPYLLLGIVTLAGVVFVKTPEVHHLLAFLGGIAASLLVRVRAFPRFACHRGSSLLAISLVAFTVVVFPSAHGIVPVMLLSVPFALIAGGNSLFGLLVHPVSRLLGEMAYSIYLLHGITLFTVFTFLVGIREAKDLSPLAHWILVIGLSPVLIVTCFCTFRLIERPAMQRTNAVTGWIRSCLTVPTNRRTASSESTLLR